MTNKPGESIVKHFWIRDNVKAYNSHSFVSQYICFDNPNAEDIHYHVIEYKAVEALNKKVEKLLSALNKINKYCTSAEDTGLTADEFGRIAHDAIAECEKDEV